MITSSIPSVNSPAGPICFHCGMDERATKFKRCGGCGLAVYCGKPCQRASWPKHRKICASKPPSGTGKSQTAARPQYAGPDSGSNSCIARYGFSSRLELFQTVITWAETHSTAIGNICRASVILDRDLHTDLATSHTITFSIGIGRNNTGDGNPAREFQLARITLEPQALSDEAHSVSSRGSMGQADPDSKAAQTNTPLASTEPRSTGTIRTKFVLKDLKTVLSSQLCMSRVRNGEPDRLPSDAGAVLEDVRDICAECIAQGIVLSPPGARHRGSLWRARSSSAETSGSCSPSSASPSGTQSSVPCS
ncbi:hypothetical protein BD413DRAFT_28492 [Trametes elegans]|nr:hypothetical protein BD413DRAFT_28492 [Trametes elegans]